MITQNKTHPLDIALQHSIRGEGKVAEQILRSLPQDDPRVLFNLGWYDLQHGKFEQGMQGMSVGRWLNVFGSPPLGAGTPIWNGDELTNKTIVFHSEGGFGDQIINIRFAKNFRDMGAKVIASCSPQLFPIFRELPYIDHCVHSEYAKGVDHDYWVPGMSAAQVLNLSYETLPNTAYIPKFTARKLSDKFNVGIRWAGNPHFEHEQNRKFDPTPLVNLKSIKGVQLYSFQRDADVVDLPSEIIDLQHELKTWKDTAEYISGLDLLITSCTSVAHLSAAMGIPTWIIVPILPYYLWAMPGNKSPWYESVTLYRQEKFGNWNAPLRKIQKDLKKLVNG